jgi:aspartyl/asparaginyl beta-hydroxylase (cupin superfamily)
LPSFLEHRLRVLPDLDIGPRDWHTRPAVSSVVACPNTTAAYAEETRTTPNLSILRPSIAKPSLPITDRDRIYTTLRP